MDFSKIMGTCPPSGKKWEGVLSHYTLNPTRPDPISNSDLDQPASKNYRRLVANGTSERIVA